MKKANAKENSQKKLINGTDAKLRLGLRFVRRYDITVPTLSQHTTVHNGVRKIVPPSGCPANIQCFQTEMRLYILYKTDILYSS